MSDKNVKQSFSRDWFKKPARILQFNVEDKFGVYLGKIKGSDIARLAKDLHANVIVMFARDPWGRILFNGEVAPKHPKIGGRDFLKELIEEARKYNIKVVTMVAHTTNKLFYQLHSDWVQKNIRGEVVVLEHIPFEHSLEHFEWPIMCINSPYMDYLKQEVREAIEKLKPQGVLLDSFRYQPDYEKACYCKYCRELFRKEKGYDIPTEHNWRDSTWRELWRWRYEVVVKKIKELYDIAKNIDPNTVFMYNSHPGGWGGRPNKIVEMARNFIDVVFAECSESDHQPPGFITEMVRLTRAMNGNKPVWASRNYFHMYRTTTATTPIAIKQGLREAVIGGGSPWILIFSSAYVQDRRCFDTVAEVFKELENIEEYLEEAEPIKYVAIVASNNTRDFYGRDHPEIYVDEVRGFYYALVHNHIPVEFVSDRDLTRSYLDKYDVVVLANTVCLSDQACLEIEKYVDNGGGIVATYLTSTLNENGVERHEYALGNVLGIELIGILTRTWSYISFVKKHPITYGLNIETVLWGDMDYEFRRRRTARDMPNHAIVRGFEGTDVLAVVAEAFVGYGYEYTRGRSSPPLMFKTEAPAILTYKYGEGKTVYFSGKLGRHYWRTGLPEYKNLIVNSTKWVARKQPPILTDAPETVEIAMFKQRERIIIHLLNHTYNQRILARSLGKPKQPIPGYSGNDTVHPPREVVPVNNISLKVKRTLISNYPCKIYSALTKISLDHKLEKDYIKIVVPKVKEYEVIVIEPKQ